MSIKQEPVEWSDFEHEPANLNKSSIEVAVKPELIYSKGDTDEEGKQINLSKSLFFVHKFKITERINCFFILFSFFESKSNINNQKSK